MKKYWQKQLKQFKQRLTQEAKSLTPLEQRFKGMSETIDAGLREGGTLRRSEVTDFFVEPELREELRAALDGASADLEAARAALKVLPALSMR